MTYYEIKGKQFVFTDDYVLLHVTLTLKDAKQWIKLAKKCNKYKPIVDYIIVPNQI